MPFHTRNQRWACMVAHRRAGKTVACVNELIARALYTKKKHARYGYIAPFRSQAEEVAWQYLKDYSGRAAVKIMESELSIELPNGAKIRLYGSDNPNSFRGVYFDGVVLDEYGDMRPSVWSSVLLPTLADRNGFAIFIGTPKGKNHFFDIWQRSRGERLNQDETVEQIQAQWFNLMLKASDSGILSPEILNEQRSQMSEDEYLQEYECSFEAAVAGAYYSKILQIIEGNGQVNDTVQWDPDFPVNAVFDLGFTDSTAVWFWQERFDGIAVIDFYENDTQHLGHYVQMLRGKGYRYNRIWLPHDAKAKTLQTTRSTVEQFVDAELPRWDVDVNPIAIVPNLSLQDGIEAARLILPSCHFNKTRCKEGIEALRYYHREWDEVNKCFRDAPKHDWSSHPADSFRYFALVTKERIVRTKRPLTQGMQVQKPDITLDALWEDRNRQRAFRRDRV